MHAFAFDFTRSQHFSFYGIDVVVFIFNNQNQLNKIEIIMKIVDFFSQAIRIALKFEKPFSLSNNKIMRIPK